MGLYSSFDTSQYYDTPPKKKEQKKVTEHKNPNNNVNNYVLTPQKRKSLYEEAKYIRENASDKSKVDFREIYRIGQMVMIQKPNGEIRTRKGRIIEIVANDLMYVGMEDTYKDVNGNWLVDFVTGDSIITKL